MINTYLKKEEKSQIHNLILYFKDQEGQTKPKVNRRKDITKTRAEINEIETEKTIQKITETNS